MIESLDLAHGMFPVPVPKFQPVAYVSKRMGLEIRKGKSKWWYGRVTFDGRLLFINLGVEIEGTVPQTLRQLGDAKFERSRARAQVAFEKLQEEYQRKSKSIEIVQKIHELKTGYRVASIRLNDIFERWRTVPRRRKASESYVQQLKSLIGRFVSYLAQEAPALKDMAGVQSSHAQGFLHREESRGISNKTYNTALILLRSVFHVLRRESGSPENPFEGIPTKENNYVSRKPFTETELLQIIREAKKDPFIYPIIVTGACTAMRRGDCCLLKVKAVDLDSRFINVATAKTHETVQIPIFPLLEEVLREALPSADGYVFPEQAMMYRTNPDGITLRVKKVLKASGFSALESEDAAARPNLNEATPIKPSLSQHRKTGLRRASIRDFHSFRVTWITLALSAGVPIELVRRVTGHCTTEIVLKHYFRPDAESFRTALASRLPVLAAPAAPKASPPSQTVLTKLSAMNADNWEAMRDEMLKELAKAGNSPLPELQ